MKRGANSRAARGEPFQTRSAPERIPRVNEMIVATVRRPRVYGRAAPMIDQTGVGKYASE